MDSFFSYSLAHHCLQMTKYSHRMELDYNDMQSDMAEGSAWADRDVSDDFPEASGSGHGPGKRYMLTAVLDKLC